MAGDLSSTVEVGFNVMKLSNYFVSLQTSVVITDEYNVMVNSEKLTGTTEIYLVRSSSKVS